MKLAEQYRSVRKQVRRYGMAGIAMHLAGFAIGFVSTGLVLQGVIGIKAGTTLLTPFSDILYGLGLVIVVAVAARAGVPMKYLVLAGAVIGKGSFTEDSHMRSILLPALGSVLPTPPTSAWGIF